MRRESAEQRRLREYRETVPPNLRKYAKPEHSRAKVSAIRLLHTFGADTEALQAMADGSDKQAVEFLELVGSAFEESRRKREEECK